MRASTGRRAASTHGCVAVSTEPARSNVSASNSRARISLSSTGVANVTENVRLSPMNVAYFK